MYTSWFPPTATEKQMQKVKEYDLLAWVGLVSTSILLLAPRPAGRDTSLHSLNARITADAPS
jgi:hypothetical protein